MLLLLKNETKHNKSKIRSLKKIKDDNPDNTDNTDTIKKKEMEFNLNS